ncbi:MAG TPA: hypothetical protein VIL36_05395 [Acidimicrobiales bacterium]
MNDFQVTATHDGSVWQVRVDDKRGDPVGETLADAVDGIDAAARALVAGRLGIRPEEITLRVDIRVEPTARARLDRIDDLRRQLDEELRAAEALLTDAGLVPGDVYALLTDVITNQEIASHGLERHPQAIAVRFDDRGRFTTVTCRSCLESDRASYATLPPGDRNTLVRRGPVMCDVCFEDRS